MTPRRRDRPTARDLVALADGSLPAARRVRVERAVAASPELQAIVAAQRRALAAVGDAAGEQAPPGLRARIALADAPRRRAPRGPRLRRAVAWAPAAGAVAALVVIAVLALGRGGVAAPTVADAAVLAARAPTALAPARHGDSATLPRLRGAGLPFPYWHDRFGWKAAGVRRDELAGRPATTVVYRRAGRSIAYTIVGGPPLALGAPVRRTVSGTTTLRTLAVRGRPVVTWLRRGHTCVLSGDGVAPRSLERLAAWTGGGDIPY
jgi:hypothetical protein